MHGETTLTSRGRAAGLRQSSPRRPGWLPLVPTPPYTEHPSGHAGLSATFGAFRIADEQARRSAGRSPPTRERRGRNG